MIGLLQRVTSAQVFVDDQAVASIRRGLLVFVGIDASDRESTADHLLRRILDYRMFEDERGRMNRSLRDLGPTKAGLLLVPQFTLVADTRCGNRPSFSSVADPLLACRLYTYLVEQATIAWASMGSGIFGTEMRVELTNSGPATFILRS